MICRIAITGPECTGKTWIAKQLAGHFNTLWVPEYAREYLSLRNNKYTYNDLEIIARGQLEAEDQISKKATRLVICDTDFTVLKIWSEDKFKKCSPWILEKFQKHNYDLYLLMNIDMPWMYDPQREDPGRREFLYEWYKKELDKLGARYAVVSGLGDERLTRAIGFINDLLNC